MCGRVLSICLFGLLKNLWRNLPVISVDSPRVSASLYCAGTKSLFKCSGRGSLEA